MSALPEPSAYQLLLERLHLAHQADDVPAVVAAVRDLTRLLDQDAGQSPDPVRAVRGLADPWAVAACALWCQAVAEGALTRLADHPRPFLATLRALGGST